MTKVLITRSKLDDLATAISAKSGKPLPLTIAQMQSAVEDIPTPTLVMKSITANGTRTAGTNSGGGASKNTQTAQSTTRSTSSTYTEVISLTCVKSGTYDVYWSTFRSSTSGTWGSQLYVGNSAHGSAQTGSWSNHIQNIHMSNVQIDANEEVSVRVRSRGSNYYGYVGTLTIIEV